MSRQVFDRIKRRTMRIVFLGTAGYHPNETRQTACVMLPELGIVFDAGTGFFRVRDYLKIDELHMFLSHYHWDHVVGLTFLIDVAYQKKLEKLHIYGKPPIGSVHELFRNPFFPVALSQHPFTFKLHEWRPQQPSWKTGEALVEARLFAHHSGGSLGFRLTHKGKTVVYLTDTTVVEDAASFVRGADLFICECNFPNEMEELAVKTTHSYPRIVAKLAKEAGVKHLVLYHISPLLEQPSVLERQTQQIFRGLVTLAEDQMEVEI